MLRDTPCRNTPKTKGETAMRQEREYPLPNRNVQKNPAYLSGKLRIFDELPSTNTYLLERAGRLPDGSAVMAKKQTAGKGRRGRSFVSPDGAGLYLSFLVRRPFPADHLPLFTPYAAVIVAEAIEELCPVTVGIKWVNDLYLGEKKLCGILTEGSFGPDGRLLYAVVGIGVNLIAGALSPELADIACAIGDFTSPPAPERLAERILVRFFGDMARLSDRSFLAEYRRRSILLGREVLTQKDGELLRGVVKAIDEDCGLCLATSRGDIVLRAGEVSVRKTAAPMTENAHDMPKKAARTP